MKSLLTFDDLIPFKPPPDHPIPVKFWRMIYADRTSSLEPKDPDWIEPERPVNVVVDEVHMRRQGKDLGSISRRCGERFTVVLDVEVPHSH